MSVMTDRAPLLAQSANESAHRSPSDPSRPARRRGRPPIRTPEQVLADIRAESEAGRLFRVHIDRPALYARARRLWGSWAAALSAAGLDPRRILEDARQRAVESRRGKRNGGAL